MSASDETLLCLSTQLLTERVPLNPEREAVFTHSAEIPIHTRHYAVVDASFGYRFQKFTIAVLGSNLAIGVTVQLSELGEGQYYRPPARRVDATLTWHYK